MANTTFTDYITPTPAAWLNDINSVAYNILGNGTSVPASVAALLTNLGVLSKSQSIGRPSTVVTVGSANCDYTTIQAALTANPVSNALFLIMPGTYTNDTINFTANGQCVVGLGTTPQQTVTQVSSTISSCGAFTNCRLFGITLTISGATSAVSAISITTGFMEVTEVDINVTNASVTTATQPSIISISSTGTAAVEFGDFVYTNNVSDGTGSTAVKAAFLLGAGLLEVEGIDITMNCQGLSLGSTLAYTASSGSLVMTGSNEVVITDTQGTVVVGYFSSGSGTLSELAYSDWTITGGGANSCMGIYLTGTATLKSHHNDFVVTGGLTNYSVNVAAGATVNSQFDVFVAASGKTGAGTFSYILSDTSGNLQTSGSITPSQTGGIVGTTTNNNASVGSVGELVSSTVAINAVSLTFTTPANITSISLTAGDWDVWGTVAFSPAATTSINWYQASVNTTSGADGTLSLNSSRQIAAAVVPAVNFTNSSPHWRLSVSSTTIVYLVADAAFTVSTMTAGGTINARRRR